MFLLIIFHSLILALIGLHSFIRSKINDERIICEYSLDLRNFIYILFNVILFGFSFKALTKNKALLSNI